MAMVAPSTDSAQSSEVEKLLAGMRAAYSGAKSATFTVDVVTMTASGRQNYSIKAQYKSPKMFSTEMTTPIGNAFTRSDGKTIWFTQISNDTVQEMPWSLDNLQRATSGNLETICFMDYERQLSTAEGKNMETSKLKIRKDVEWNSKKWTVLDEVSDSVGVAVDYYIDPETHIIHRTEIFNTDRSQFIGSFKVKDMKLNAKVDETKFKKPPVVTKPAQTITI